MRWLPHPPPMLDASPTCTDVGRAKNLRLRFPVGISDKNHERRAASWGELAGPSLTGELPFATRAIVDRRRCRAQLGLAERCKAASRQLVGQAAQYPHASFRHRARPAAFHASPAASDVGARVVSPGHAQRGRSLFDQATPLLFAAQQLGLAADGFSLHVSLLVVTLGFPKPPGKTNQCLAYILRVAPLHNEARGSESRNSPF